MNSTSSASISSRRRALSIVALTILFGLAQAAAKDDKPPEAASPAAVKPGSTALLKSAGKGDALLPARAETIAQALEGKAAEWIPKWAKSGHICGATNSAKPLIADYLKQREAQCANAAALSNKTQTHSRSNQRDDAFDVFEELRKERLFTYQGYFAWKQLSEKK